MPLSFEWNTHKAHLNRQKHGIGFDEAATVFGDALADRTVLDCWLWCTPKEATISALSARDRQVTEKGTPMKKANKRIDSGMRAEYEFADGIRGKYAKRYAEGSNVVVLDPDVAKAFPSADAVNHSLRALAGIIRQQKAAVAK